MHWGLPACTASCFFFHFKENGKHLKTEFLKESDFLFIIIARVGHCFLPAGMLLLNTACKQHIPKEHNPPSPGGSLTQRLLWAPHCKLPSEQS